MHPSAFGVEHVGAQRAVVAREPRALDGQQVHRAVGLEERDVGMRAHARDQRALDLPSRRVAVVKDAPVAVAALPTEVEGEVRSGAGRTRRIEVGAELQQLVDHRGRALDDRLHDFFAAEARTRVDRVARVGVEGVLVVQDGRDPALRRVRRRVCGALLGDDRDGPVLGDLQAVEEPGDPASDDEDIGVVAFLHGGSPIEGRAWRERFDLRESPEVSD